MQDLSSFLGRRSASNEVPLYSAHLEGALIRPLVRDHDLLLLIAFAEWPDQANANPQLSFQWPSGTCTHAGELAPAPALADC